MVHTSQVVVVISDGRVMERNANDDPVKRAEDLRRKLGELRESREYTEKTLTDCRLRWERLREEEVRFAHPEDLEELLESYDEGIGLTYDERQRDAAIERRVGRNSGDGKESDGDEKRSLCSLLNMIWMELIGLVLTLYTFLRVPKRKM